ncbi:MAG: hypothetical protein M0P22_12170 [Methanoculleus sp.]|nr:hypothetical protein [Methanoculleus sp.]
MNFRLLSALIVLLVAFSLCAACTGSGEPTGPSQTQTPAVTATPAPTTSVSPVSLTPGPTQTAPPGKEVEFQLTGGYPSRITNDLYVGFRGGKGQDFVTSINVRVTKSTGEVITETLRPVVGDAGELIIHNAKGENRVEITVALVTGGSYKVTDEIVKVP